MDKEGEVSEEDFKNMMKEFSPDFVWPVYDDFENITVTSTDKNGITWVVMMPAEKFHNAMQESAKKLFDNENK